MISPLRVSQIRSWCEVSENGHPIIWHSSDIRDILTALDKVTNERNQAHDLLNKALARLNEFDRGDWIFAERIRAVLSGESDPASEDDELEER